MRARPIDDKRQHNRLAALELHAARERRVLAHLHVVGDRLPEFERAMVQPNLASEFRELEIGLELLSRDGNHETVDIFHDEPPYAAAASTKRTSLSSAPPQPC